MRNCIAAMTGFKNMITCSSSEPLLAGAAFHLMLNIESSPVKRLANHAYLYCVDRGRRGELVAALIIMQARDASLPRNLLQRRWVSVTDFMKALLPPQASEKFLKIYSTRWREEGNTTFRVAFGDCRLWFNHIIKVEYFHRNFGLITALSINPKFPWKYVTRGAMIVCKNINKASISSCQWFDTRRRGRRHEDSKHSETLLRSRELQPAFPSALPAQHTARVLRCARALVEAPTAMHAHQLCKGEAVVFDNRQVLHGRTAFGLRRFESMDHREAGGGLRGCYFEGDTMASLDKILCDRVARGERGVI